MWIVLNNAFLSIVEHDDDRKLLLVRGRFPGDVARFLGAKLGDEEITPWADYRYRMVATRAQVRLALTRAVTRIDYGNFKNSIKEPFRKRPAMTTWQAWWEAQEDQREDRERNGYHR